jgi:hypothetical protein
MIKTKQRKKLPFTEIKPSSFYANTATTTNTNINSVTNTQYDNKSNNLTRWKQVVEAATRDSLHKRNNIFIVWRVFWKQDSAFKFIDSSPLPLRVFSFEYDLGHPGKRKFLVTTLDDFWSSYHKLEPHERVYYELIRMDAPCKLYFE